MLTIVVYLDLYLYLSFIVTILNITLQHIFSKLIKKTIKVKI